MHPRRISVAIAALSIPLLAGGAVAVASSVGTRPGPQVIIPSRTSSVTPVTTRADHRRISRTDDPAGHDTPATTTPDDHGDQKPAPVSAAAPTTSDDSPGHDAPSTTTPDDHGTDATTGTTTPDDHGHDGTTATTAPDDGPGHDASGHDASGHDASGHDASDDAPGH